MNYMGAQIPKGSRPEQGPWSGDETPEAESFEASVRLKECPKLCYLVLLSKTV